MKKQIYDTIDSKLLRSFEVLKKVGQGAYGQVWKAKNKKTGAICALKKIYDAFRNPTDAQKAYRQIKYLQKLDHPNIIKLLGYHKPTNNQDIYLQEQFLEADLSVALRNSLLKEIHKHYIFYQMVNALNYLHTAELIHRDIKPSNVLINETCDVKLCDFGLIRSLKKDSPNQQLLMTQNVATRWYRAPQVLLSTNTYGKGIDIWSLGCVLAEMFLQRPIFQGNSTISQLQKIFQITGKPSFQDLHFIRNEASLKIVEAIQTSKNKELKDLFPHEDKNLIDLLQKIFKVNPNLRPTIQQILNHPFLNRFRGRVEEKVPFEAIKVVHDSHLLTKEDYRNLLYGEIGERDCAVKNNDDPGPYPSIFKTVPSNVSRPNYLKSISPYGRLENKSPIFLNNGNRKCVSPGLGEIKRETTNASDVEQYMKKQRHSPSFLHNRKKNQTKLTPDKTLSRQNTQALTQINHQNQVKKMMTFPMRNSPKRESPLKFSPLSKVQKEKNYFIQQSIKSKETNPESLFDIGKSNFNLTQSIKGRSIINPVHQHQNQIKVEEMPICKAGSKILKQRLPKFILQGGSKEKDKLILKGSPNKSRENKLNPSPIRQKITTFSPISKGQALPHHNNLIYRTLSPISIELMDNGKNHHKFSPSRYIQIHR